MKILFASLLCTLLSVAAFAQNDQEPAKTGPIMTFEKMTVDYGDIEQGSDPLRVLKFTNTGNEPLIIKHAKGSCGCTVPSYKKEPILPGESSEIEIRYDTKRPGPIRKTVKITTNEGGDPHVIQVRGNVDMKKKTEEEALPTKKGSLIDG